MLHLGILNRNSELFWLMVWILIIEWLMWNSFRASNAGKGILQCSGMGRYWELSGGLGAWNLETIRVWYLIWSIFWDKWPKFSVWHSFWGPYFSSQSQSGMKPSCLDYLNFYRLGPEFRHNSEHFFDKNAQKLDFRLGNMFWPVWLAASQVTLGKCSCCVSDNMKMAIRSYPTSIGTWKYW